MMLLFEIGTEELPAGEIDTALDALQQHFVGRAAEARLTHGSVRTFATPRRLALQVEDIAATAADAEELVTGPAAAAAFDKDGNPTRAAEGFARSRGADVGDLLTIETAKGPYVALRIRHEGKPAAELLPAVLETAFGAIPWKRSMRWGWGTEAFARPVHWIVALLDSEVLPVSFAGITSERTTRGHRFLAPDPVSIAHARDWQESLRSAFVIACPDERRGVIVEGLDRLAGEAGLARIADDALLDEVVHLVEWPEPMMGHFPERFLELPPEVLITSMRSHQRYFALEQSASKLSNAFGFVSNMRVEKPEVIVAGNLRVLQARLEDARFFHAEDRKRSLESRVADLGRVVYIDGLGSVEDRQRRIVRLVGELAERYPGITDDDRSAARRAAELCKADLVTGMVGEFPELQGTVGRHYALLDGESEAVAVAIEEHYRPRGASDAPPETHAGVLVALAEKLDGIVGAFAIGMQPSGSADPYGLRRAALGVVRILLHHGLPMQLREVVAATFDGLPPGDLAPMNETVDAVVQFLRGRVRSMFTADHDTDIVDAALAVALDDLPTLRPRILAITAMRDEADFAPLAEASKRVANILAKAQEAGELEGLSLDETLFAEQSERDLGRGLAVAEDAAGKAYAERDFRRAARALVALKGPIDAFFDQVLVNAEDDALRRNRLALLARLRKLFLQLADISLVQAS